MLRVGLDLTPLLGSPTGIHQHTRAVLDALGERDDVDVSGWLLSARARRVDLGVPVRRARIPAGLAQRAWRVSSFPGARMLAGDVDVVHGTNFLAPPAAGSVVTIQDATPLRHPELTLPAVAAKAGAIRRLLRSAALIHVSSQLVADELVADHGADPDRVALVHHGLPRRPVPTPHPGFPGHDRYIVVLGTTERRKRVPAIVEAVQHLPDDVALVVAGPVGNDEPRVQAAIRRLDDPDRIVRVTAASDDARDSLVAGAAALVSASEYEGFGFTPLESIRLGTPIAATAVGALPEIVGRAVPLVDPGATDLVGALASSISAVLGSEAPTPAREAVDRLSWAAHAAAMVELYRRAANDR